MLGDDNVKTLSISSRWTVAGEFRSRVTWPLYHSIGCSITVLLYKSYGMHYKIWEPPILAIFPPFILFSYMTGFVKRGLPHTSNLPILTIHNFNWLMLLTWNLLSRKYQHWWIAREGFSFVCHLIIKLWSSKFIELNVCVEDPFSQIRPHITYISDYAQRCVKHVNGSMVSRSPPGKISVMISEHFQWSQLFINSYLKTFLNVGNCILYWVDCSIKVVQSLTSFQTTCNYCFELGVLYIPLVK